MGFARKRARSTRAANCAPDARSRRAGSFELSCGGAERSSRRGSQQGNSLAAKQFVSLGNFVDRRAPIEHCQEISSAHGSALLNDVLCDVLRRAGDELVALSVNPPEGAGASGTLALRRSSSATKLFKRSATCFA